MRTNFKFIFVLIAVIFTSNLTSVQAFQNSNDKFVVVLDAGHGGKDPGKPSKAGYKEKDIALKIVLAVGKALEKNKDIKVVYTRKKDVFVDLFVRGRIANKANADLFISVHCNAHTSQAYGAETYVLGVHRNQTNFNVAKAENEVIFLEENHEKNYEGFDPSSPESAIGLTLMQEEFLDQSIQLAKNIQDNFTYKLKRKNRGVKQAGFIVLHQTVMPSVLVETGFITNTREGKYLNSKKGQTELAASIEKAVLKYKSVLEQNVGEELFEEAENNIASNNTEASEPELIYKDVIFKVQIAASSRKLMPKSYNFKGLENISREQVNKLYKYFYGNTSNYNEAKRLQEKAEQKGYSGCFIVAYKDGNRINLSDLEKQQ
ncbi:N-acetylmuramoyl-L-alanine amidase family protein [Ichthyenterobacterium magnum]|uniref:N-acetylmuramoyl-L-alanine amidase n=1 Tax=Ichthyenterobacterium magnum TaxID=1230530 RepID=A0A420DMG4_9FLAO|nr:N-acetylmuramoyl-L-alanine amidase [Ichthyenterobacterium magnum]RKE95433.1 N-acetylmuramoyl-L-alanine amidase [Ichthyenterobacterium magnum]